MATRYNIKNINNNYHFSPLSHGHQHRPAANRPEPRCFLNFHDKADITGRPISVRHVVKTNEIEIDTEHRTEFAKQRLPPSLQLYQRRST